jgi:aryl-alcohol dehydrogenase-like predicted oxidoreductase
MYRGVSSAMRRSGHEATGVPFVGAGDAQEDNHMEYTKLGTTGMDVSRICLGCMGFGDAEHWVHKWVLDEDQSRPIIKHALDLGINFFDTANIYSIGRSEEILGRALKDYAKRDEVVIATKLHGRMHEGPNGAGLSRKAIMSEIEKSLKRLQTDYVDLYQIHRWDYATPIEETMEALHDVVKAGKVRYIGASAMWAWQFQRALHVAEKHRWTRFVSMQNHLNLIYREEEREMLPLCRAEGIGVIPYSPLASGRLTRDWSSETTVRSETDEIAKGKYDATADTDRLVVERVAELAGNHGVPRVHIALAWLLQKQPVTAPIIGATKTSHLQDAVGALSVKLSEDEVVYLEEPYVPHRIVGHQ